MIPCAVCLRPYEVKDIGTLLFMSTGVCVACYKRALTVSGDLWCFGKIEAYDEISKECSQLCPDKLICKAVVKGKLVL